ncbi:lipase [Streptomyces sp. SID13031]|uniref:alpha/beta hydrolase family protein n=1 Tax=Streptomyces sp. SID13031 TaxID=2706046 RepID=UPI0013C8615A|nr:lipase [Streptomyces sp. SID13031]NEA35590.1 lipase [Streptomyces sp. SID13031]
MTNYQSFSRRWILGTGLAASLMLSTTALAQAYPVGERDADPAAGSGLAAAATATTYPPTKIHVPAPTGPNKIGTIELHLIDQARDDASAPGGKRELMVSVWYPARPRAEGPFAKYMPPKTADVLSHSLSKAAFGLDDPIFDFAGSDTQARVGVPAERGKHPVVLYSPGYPLSRYYGTAQVEELASRGYVVVTMDHTHEGPVEFPGGRFVPGTDVLLPTADQTRAALDTRVADTRFVLDQVTLLAYGLNPDAERRNLPAGLRQALDIRNVGMFGFSAGGHTAADTMAVDGRINAGVDLDGTLAYDMQLGPLGPAAERGLDRPFMLFGSDGSQRTDPAVPDTYDKSWAAFWKNQRGWKLNLQLPGTNHLGFSDYQFFFYDVFYALTGDDDGAIQVQANVGGILDRHRMLLAQRTYLTAFFDQFLQGRPQRLLEKESAEFPEVGFVR